MKAGGNARLVVHKKLSIQLIYNSYTLPSWSLGARNILYAELSYAEERCAISPLLKQL